MKNSIGDDSGNPLKILKAVHYDLCVRECEDDAPVVFEPSLSKLGSLWSIHQFVATVLKSNDAAFKVERKGVHVRLEPSSKLKLHRYFNVIKTSFGLVPEGTRFYGFVGLFFESCDELDIEYGLLLSPMQSYSDKKIAAEIFNDLLEKIRELAKSSKYKKTVKDLKYRTNRNFRSMRNYVDALFESYSKLLVLRIDFGYHRVQGIPIRVERILNDFTRLLNNRRSNGLFEHIVGYIRRLEYGDDKSWHLHVMLFFNGQETQSDQGLARRICEYWRAGITDNDGTAFNCNASKNKYKYCGIGKIDHADTERRTHLLYALTYLTKKDAVLGFDVPKGVKMITRGEMPKPPVNRLGRKRKSSA